MIDVIFYVSLIGAVLMSFSLGGNDASNSMASAVGAKAITMRQAIFIAGIMNFVGAAFLGAAVTATVAGGIVDPSSVPRADYLAIGMVSALFSAGLFVLAATLLGLPVSSSHATIGAIGGFGIAAAGFDAVQWSTIGIIVIAWILTPFVSGLVSFLLNRLVRFSALTTGDERRRIVEVLPIWMGVFAVIVVLFLTFDVFPQLERAPVELGLLLIVAALVVYVLGYRLLIIRHFEKQHSAEDTMQHSFRRLQIFSSSYISLAHGANDVANAFGPVIAIYFLARQGAIPADAPVPTWVLIVGGAGIAAGIAAIGQRVIKTIGENLTELDNVKGFSADFSIAATVMSASQLGLPVSSSHAAVGAISGAGLSSGGGKLNIGLLGKIFVSWIITVPVAALVSALIYLVLVQILPSA